MLDVEIDCLKRKNSAKVQFFAFVVHLGQANDQLFKTLIALQLRIVQNIMSSKGRW